LRYYIINNFLLNIFTMQKYFYKYISFLILVIISITCTTCNHKKGNPISEFAKSASSSFSKNQIIPKGTAINILIDKSEYRLYVYAADTIIKSYPIVLGGNPIDDKLREGDQCTPEGSFKMISKYPHKSWSKFIWINYPTEDSWRKHKKAKANGILTKNTNIGGEIGIHGVPKGTDNMIENSVNWTLGCISLTNTDINELYPFVTDKTIIKIQK